MSYEVRQSASADECVTTKVDRHERRHWLFKVIDGESGLHGIHG